MRLLGAFCVLIILGCGGLMGDAVNLPPDATDEDRKDVGLCSKGDEAACDRVEALQVLGSLKVVLDPLQPDFVAVVEGKKHEQDLVDTVAPRLQMMSLTASVLEVALVRWYEQRIGKDLDKARPMLKKLAKAGGRTE